MSVVGFDVGNDCSHVAVARRRVIDILQNSSGSRRTSTLVGFNGDERVIGDAAAMQMGANFKNTVAQVKRFVGLRYGSDDMKEELKYAPTPDQIVPSPVGPGVAFRVRYNGEVRTLPAEQIAAAMLEELRGTAEAGLGPSTRVRDCVVAAPAYWTDAQRRAMLDACRLADLNVLRLVNETTAVALQYGILRPLPEKETRNVLFVDVSHASTQAAAVAFKTGRLDVLATDADRHLGARNFDLALFEHLAADIAERYKLPVRENAKARMKLMKECARIKKVLSANTQTPFNVEYLMNDTDVSGKITRDEFEAACAGLVARVTQPLDRALAAAGLRKEDLYAVEVVGGASRIPMVLQALQSWFGRDVSRTCDGDESVARGAALVCAMMSPSFKVREFEVHDITQYAVDATWGVAAPADGGARDSEELTPPASENETAQLFKPLNSIPCTKMFTLKGRKEPFQVELSYAAAAADDLPGGAPRLAGRYVVGAVDQESFKHKVRVKIDVHGITHVTQVSEFKEVEEQVEEVVEEEDEAAAAPAGTEKKQEEEQQQAEAEVAEKKQQEAADPEAAPSTPAPMDEDAPEATESTEEVPAAAATEEAAASAMDTEATPEPEPAPKKTRMVTKTKTRKTVLALGVHAVGGLSEAAFKATYEVEAAMAAQDRLVKATQESRNEVESYVYDMRGKVQDGELAAYVSDADRDAFVAALDETESWLYGEGEEAQKSAYDERLKSLRKMGEPIRARQREEERRDDKVTHLKATILRFELEAASEDEKFAHIEAEEREKVAKRAKEAGEWLEKKLQEQQVLAKTQDPAFTCDQIDAKAREVEALCAPIMNKPKPKPEPKSEEKKEAGKEDQEAEAAGGDAEMAPAGDEAGGDDDDAAAAAAAAETEDVPMGDASANGGDSTPASPMDE